MTLDTLTFMVDCIQPLLEFEFQSGDADCGCYDGWILSTHHVRADVTGHEHLPLIVTEPIQFMDDPEYRAVRATLERFQIVNDKSFATYRVEEA